MTEGEVVEVARRLARERGWSWLDPVSARRTRRWLIFGEKIWIVLSNAKSIGCQVQVTIDDATGAVLSASFRPR